MSHPLGTPGNVRALRSVDDLPREPSAARVDPMAAENAPPTMTALGAFAGGIAHVFNNLLTAIGFETELAAWRRRALSAESRLNEVAGGESGVAQTRLEEENRALAQRLQAAKGHLGELLDRLRFLEQQQGNGANHIRNR